MSIPKTFISYSWDNEEHRNWIRELATKLRSDGIDVMLDQWHLVPGDQMPEFMERAVRDNDFVLIACTPNYKQKSDNRTGGVGYEGNIMTSELAVRLNQRKFIPILHNNEWNESAPSWLLGKFYINLADKSFETNYKELLATLHGQRAGAPPIGKRPDLRDRVLVPDKLVSGVIEPLKSKQKDKQAADNPKIDEPIKITGIVEGKITTPRMDNTRGSGLYAIPFQLSRKPSADWSRLFVENWNNPPMFTTMHRSGIGKVSGDCIVLDGTTMEEVKNYHQKTLLLVVEKTNQQYAQYQSEQQQKMELKSQQELEHFKKMKDTINQIKFD